MSTITLTAAPQEKTAPQVGPRATGDPCTLVIFGGVGDLARRLLMPAIYQLAVKKLLPPQFRILGVGLDKHDDTSFRTTMRSALEQFGGGHADEAVWNSLAERMFWTGANLTDAAAYTAILDRVVGFEKGLPADQTNRLFYLAVPPVIFEPIVKNLVGSGLCKKDPDPHARPWRRVIVEKPFGTSLGSAQALSKAILDVVAEPQVYRIDHYVGKETVQNVLVLRSANHIFESIWNRRHISHVEISACESVGVEDRAKYYETSGVVRDMFQNHLLQLVALTAMESPVNPSADAVHDEKVKVLRAIRPFVQDGKVVGAVRAQYGAGDLGGKPAAGYKQEPGVAATSITPTYSAIRMYIDNERWQGVPFYVRSGKRLKRKCSEIALHFKAPEKLMYEPCPGEENPPPNVLVIRVQPNEGISLSFEVKIPGAALTLTPGIEIQQVDMDFAYADAFGEAQHPAYETLLLDCMIGDATLFTRTDEVEAAWKLTDPLLNIWDADKSELPTYPVGSQGPAVADALLSEQGFKWRPL
jgi:glucose-6-phosphate 1-dehydrogenase